MKNVLDIYSYVHHHIYIHIYIYIQNYSLITYNYTYIKKRTMEVVFFLKPIASDLPTLTFSTARTVVTPLWRCPGVQGSFACGLRQPQGSLRAAAADTADSDSARRFAAGDLLRRSSCAATWDPGAWDSNHVPRHGKGQILASQLWMLWIRAMNIYNNQLLSIIGEFDAVARRRWFPNTVFCVKPLWYSDSFVPIAKVTNSVAVCRLTVQICSWRTDLRYQKLYFKWPHTHVYVYI